MNAQSDRLWAVALLGAALVLFLVGLGDVALRDWDEATVAQVAREIRESGPFGWLTLTLWGEPYVNKPPLVHALIAASFEVLGESEFAARLPSALLTAVSVPLVFALAREVFQEPLPARCCALVYLTLLPVVRHGRLAMLDGPTVTFFIMMVLSLLMAREQRAWLWAAGAGFGLMLLTKGLLGVILLCILFVYLAWERSSLLRTPQLWLALLLGLAPAAAWFGLQWHHHGSYFYHEAIFTQSLDRVVFRVGGQGGPPWYYLVEILKYGWPWLAFLPAGLWLAIRARDAAWARLGLAWLVLYLALISLLGTKQPWYVYPIYPALALIIGAALAEAIRGFTAETADPDRFAMLFRAGVFMLAPLSLAAIAGSLFFTPLGPDPLPAITAASAIIAVGLGSAFVLARRRDSRFCGAIAASAFAALLLLVLSDRWVWELGEDFPVTPVARLVRDNLPADSAVRLVHRHGRPSLNYYSGRKIDAATLKDLKESDPDGDTFWLVGLEAVEGLVPPATVVAKADGWALVLSAGARDLDGSQVP